MPSRVATDPFLSRAPRLERHQGDACPTTPVSATSCGFLRTNHPSGTTAIGRAGTRHDVRPRTTGGRPVRRGPLRSPPLSRRPSIRRRPPSPSARCGWCSKSSTDVDRTRNWRRYSIPSCTMRWRRRGLRTRMQAARSCCVPGYAPSMPTPPNCSVPTRVAIASSRWPVASAGPRRRAGPRTGGSSPRCGWGDPAPPGGGPQRRREPPFASLRAAARRSLRLPVAAGAAAPLLRLT